MSKFEYKVDHIHLYPAIYLEPKTPFAYNRTHYGTVYATARSSRLRHAESIACGLNTQATEWHTYV